MYTIKPTKTVSCLILRIIGLKFSTSTICVFRSLGYRENVLKVRKCILRLFISTSALCKRFSSHLRHNTKFEWVFIHEQHFFTHSSINMFMNAFSIKAFNHKISNYCLTPMNQESICFCNWKLQYVYIYILYLYVHSIPNDFLSLPSATK